jgi:hypothetical protein
MGQDDTDEAGGTWMSKVELAAVRGISVASAYRLIRRQGWRRLPGNDGRVRAYVPADWIPEPRDRPAPSLLTDRRDTPSDSDAPDTISQKDNGLLAGALAALEMALSDARQVAAEAGARADAALALADRLGSQLADARVARDRAVESTRQAEASAERARADHGKALERVRELEAADHARRMKGRLARLWAAWRRR